MSKPSLLHALALIACTCIIATTALAHDSDGILGLIEGGLGLPDVEKCLSSTLGVRGCVEEILFSVLSLKPHMLGLQCCKAYLEIDEACWPKIFPFNSGFPADLKKYCIAEEDKPDDQPFLEYIPPPPPPCSSSGDDKNSYEGGDCNND